MVTQAPAEVRQENTPQIPEQKLHASQAEANYMKILEAKGYLKVRPDLRCKYIQEDVLLVERNDGVQ